MKSHWNARQRETGFQLTEVEHISVLVAANAAAAGEHIAANSDSKREAESQARSPSQELVNRKGNEIQSNHQN